VPTLPSKHAKHVKCNAFSSVALKRTCFLGMGGSEKKRLFTADVQNDAPLLHTCTQSCCPLTVDDAVRMLPPMYW